MIKILTCEPMESVGVKLRNNGAWSKPMTSELNSRNGEKLQTK